VVRSTARNAAPWRCLLCHESASTPMACLWPSPPYSVLRKHQGDPVLFLDRPGDLWSKLSLSFPIAEWPLAAPPPRSSEPPSSLTPQASSGLLPHAPGPPLTITHHWQAKYGWAAAALTWLPPWPSASPIQEWASRPIWPTHLAGLGRSQ
jgi:hypothetical protein